MLLPDKHKRTLSTYRWLLRLYPPGFRSRFEGELVQVFQDMLQFSPQKPASAMDLWLWVFPDLLQSIVQENISIWRLEMTDKSVFWKIPSLMIFTAWIVFVGWTALNIITGRHAADPTSLLLGNSFSNFKLQTLNFFLLCSPLIVLLSYLVPLLHINIKAEDGITAQIHVRRTGRFGILIMAVSTLICLAIIGLIFIDPWH